MNILSCLYISYSYNEDDVGGRATGEERVLRGR